MNKNENKEEFEVKQEEVFGRTFFIDRFGEIGYGDVFIASPYMRTLFMKMDNSDLANAINLSTGSAHVFPDKQEIIRLNRFGYLSEEGNFKGKVTKAEAEYLNRKDEERVRRERKEGSEDNDN